MFEVLTFVCSPFEQKEELQLLCTNFVNHADLCTRDLSIFKRKSHQVHTVIVIYDIILIMQLIITIGCLDVFGCFTVVLYLILQIKDFSADQFLYDYTSRPVTEPIHKLEPYTSPLIHFKAYRYVSHM